MKFKFGYAKLLEHYHLQEEVARRDYLESLSKLDQEKALHQQMYKDLDAANDQAFKLQTDVKGAPIAEITELNNFSEGQKIRITRQREVVMNHTSIVEQKQEILIAAAKEKRILEKLKEKKLAEFKKLQKKSDAKKTDELVVTRFRAGERG